MTTAEEMEQDKTSAKKAAVALRSVIENIDAAVFSTTYTDTTKIDTIQDEQGKALAETLSAVITGPNNPAVPPKIIETTTTPNAQSCILMLQQGKSGTTIAKLTKEWIKLAESYKVPHDKVVPFSDPHAIGNQALYLLIASRTDSYFPMGNQAI